MAGPERRQVRFFSGEHEEGERLPPDQYPHLCFGEGPTKVTRYFPDKLPIGAKPYGSPHVFLFGSARTATLSTASSNALTVAWYKSCRRSSSLTRGRVGNGEP